MVVSQRDVFRDRVDRFPHRRPFSREYGVSSTKRFRDLIRRTSAAMRSPASRQHHVARNDGGGIDGHTPTVAQDGSHWADHAVYRFKRLLCVAFLHKANGGIDQNDG